MPIIAELQQLLSSPREDMDVEYKDWLDVTSNHGRATLAKAAIGLANHGGGFIVIGFPEVDGAPTSREKPDDLPEITQDNVNGAIRRYADPEFHLELYQVDNPDTGHSHIIVSVSGGHAQPVMSKRDCDGVISQNVCYIRKPGPRTEAPNTRDEWRTLLDRCVRNQREDMLDAIRAIVTGRVEPVPPEAGEADQFEHFIASARDRWVSLVEDLPDDFPARFPHGSYELAFSLVGGEACPNLNELQNRLAIARQIRLTGWSTFLQMNTPEMAPYAHDDFVEAWVGRPYRGDEDANRDPSLCDFWRASRMGQLYTIRGYSEDGLGNRDPGAFLDITIPIWRVGEGLLFASRLAETFGDVDHIAIHCRFTGLQGRTLTSIGGNRMMFDDRVSRTDEITLEGRATPEQINDNLSEVLTPLLTPLYERFDFFELSDRLVGQESQRLQQGRY